MRLKSPTLLFGTLSTEQFLINFPKVPIGRSSLTYWTWCCIVWKECPSRLVQFTQDVNGDDPHEKKLSCSRCGTWIPGLSFHPIRLLLLFWERILYKNIAVDLLSKPAKWWKIRWKTKAFSEKPTKKGKKCAINREICLAYLSIIEMKCRLTSPK